jgi:hypothetical protein
LKSYQKTEKGFPDNRKYQETSLILLHKTFIRSDKTVCFVRSRLLGLASGGEPHLVKLLSRSHEKTRRDGRAQMQYSTIPNL